MDEPTISGPREDSLNEADYDDLDSKIDQLYAMARDLRFKIMDARARGEPLSGPMLNVCRNLEATIEQYLAAGDDAQ